MAIAFDSGVAVALATSAVLATLGPPVLAFVLWRRFGAPLRAWGWGALTFVVSQVVLRLPWQIPLGVYLAREYAGRPMVMQAWLVASALSAGVFEEGGRYVAYRFVWKERTTIGGLMLGAGHGGIEAMALVGLTLVANTVLYVLLGHGVTAGLPAGALDALTRQFSSLDPGLALMPGVERLCAMTLHLACSLLVLEGVRGGRWGWLAGSVLLHGGANLLAIVVTQAGGAHLGELALALVVAPALWLALRRSRATEAGR
jgi:uncharacterized membrane protein YhfC